MKLTILNNPVWRRAAVVSLLAVAVLFSLTFAGSRIYWPFSLIAYFLGIFVYLGEQKDMPPENRRSLFGYLFPREVWLHPSSVNDAVLVLLNFALMAVMFEYISVTPETFQPITESSLGLLHAHGVSVSNPSLPVIIFFVALAIMVQELFFYFNHRLQHTVPILWELHKVHHSAQVMTPLTLYRVHPLAFVIDTIVRNLGMGLVLGIFVHLYPETKSVVIASGVVAVASALNIAAGNLHHSHIWLRFPRPVEHFITSPALHQIHHSASPAHFGKNYGTLFSFWDWVFGSLYIPKGKETITFGIGPLRTKPYLSLWGIYAHPVRQITKRIVRSKTIEAD